MPQKPKTRPEPPKTDFPARLTQFAFLLALVLACARAATYEMISDPVLPVPGALAGALTSGPGVSVLLDLLFCVPALLVLLRRAIDPTYVLRFARSHAALAALAVWLLLSPLWSADRFAALIGAANFASTLVLLWSMTQLVRSWPRARLVAAGVFGIFLVYIACGLHYRWVDLPELRRDWELNKLDHLRAQGIDPDSFAARQFEQKVLGGDVGCFGNSPNTYAAALVMTGVVAAAAAVQRFSHRDPKGWVLAVAIAFPFAAIVLRYTHSLAATLTPFLAAALLLAAKFFRPWRAAQSTKAYWIGVGAFFLGIAAVVGHGLVHGSLVLKTLTFRWYYWTGAARMVAQHPIAGVGYNNFGHHYPALRVPLATEEVKDPHNFLVRFFAELGLVGGFLVIVWLFRLFWELTRPVLPPLTPAATAPPAARPRGIVLLGLLAVATAFVNALFTIDWNQSSYAFVQSVTRAGWAILLLYGFAAVGLRSFRDESLDDRPSPWLLHGLLVAAGVFLLHNLIDFSLFETAPLSIFALIVGTAAGLRHPSAAGRCKKPLVAVGLLTAASLAFVAAFGLLLAPLLSAESSARSGDESFRLGRPADAARHYLAARESFPSNADYAFRAARALIHDQAPPPQVRDVLDAAIRTNPRDVRYHMLKAGYERRLPTPDAQAVRRSYQNALALDPRDVNLRLEYAEALAALGDRTAAAEQYRMALAYDDQLPPDEPKRLSAQRRGEIEQRITQLDG